MGIAREKKKRAGGKEKIKKLSNIRINYTGK